MQAQTSQDKAKKHLTSQQMEALAAFPMLPDAATVGVRVLCMLRGGVTPVTIWRNVKAGKLPKPVSSGPGGARWRVGDLRKVMAQ